MKTLGKLNINPEKVLKDDELKSLKGGWYGTCWIFDGENGLMYGSSAGSSSYSAQSVCESTYRPLFGGDIWCTCE
jgi:hypothetical protein